MVLNPNNAKTNKIIIYSNVSFNKISKTLKSFKIVAKILVTNPIHKINIFQKYPKTSMNYIIIIQKNIWILFKILKYLK